MPLKSVTATAHPNIALIKYWGKRDTELILPLNSSISMTLESFRTQTTISIDSQDSLNLNGQNVSKESTEFKEYIQGFLRRIRKNFPQIKPIKIISENNFPTAAGLASSASGFAALAMAINHLFDLGLNHEEISTLARQGSGSATRSVLGGFNYWLKGQSTDGTDSQIKQIAPKDHWPELRLAVAITTHKQKPISSRLGMSTTVKNSPIYQSAWMKTVEADLIAMEQAITSRDFQTLGKTAEQSALKMHATMLATTPPIVYFNNGTKIITNKLVEARNDGNLESYFTIDAGPQVKVIYLEKDQNKVDQLLRAIPEVEKIIHSKVGGDSQIIDSL